MLRVLAAAALLLPLAPLAAQRTWVVAPTGGDFTEIRQAAAVVQHDDTVLVRAGVYQSFILDKGIRLIGDPGAVVLNHPVGWSAIRVYDVPVGRTLTISGFQGQPSMGLELRNCGGHVHLEDLTYLESSNIDAPHLIGNCAEVSLSRVAMRSGLPILHSRVTLAQCLVQSWDTGLQIWNGAHVTVAETTITPTGAFGLAAQAIFVRDSTLLLGGDASMRLVAAGGSSGRPTPAVEAVDSIVVVDPEVTLVPANGAPPIAGNSTVHTVVLPTLRADLAANVLSLRVRATLATMAFTLVGLTSQPPASTPLGDVWVGAGAFVLDAGAMTAGVRSASLPVPPLPRGLTLALQSLVALPTGTGLSTPRILAVP